MTGMMKAEARAPPPSIPLCLRRCPGRDRRAALGDAGDARHVHGGRRVPAAGAAAAAGPGKQELPHPAVPPAQGGAPQPARGADRPGGRRAHPDIGAGCEGGSLHWWPEAGGFGIRAYLRGHRIVD